MAALHDLDDVAQTPPTREVLTRDNEILLRLKKPAGAWEEQKLQKGNGFKQTKSGCVLLWGGCNVCVDATITTLRKLYDKPLIIEWKGTTSRQIISKMLGGTGDNDATGDFTTSNFWTKLGSDTGDLVKVRKAWLAAANDIWPTDAVIRSRRARMRGFERALKVLACSSMWRPRYLTVSQPLFCAYSRIGATICSSRSCCNLMRKPATRRTTSNTPPGVKDFTPSFSISAFSLSNGREVCALPQRGLGRPDDLDATHAGLIGECDLLLHIT